MVAQKRVHLSELRKSVMIIIQSLREQEKLLRETESDHFMTNRQ
jgi:hypothetical protein